MIGIDYEKLAEEALELEEEMLTLLERIREKAENTSLTNPSEGV
jgi:predicted ATP-grasp superfamily ATP-dependent carboligase